MDIRNFTWVNSFQPTRTNTKEPTGNETIKTTNITGAKSTKFPIIIIVYSVTGTLGAAMIVASVIFIYRRTRTRNNNNKLNSVGHIVPEQVFDNSGKIEDIEQHNLPGLALPL
ncbi:10956_t:CDS:1 [Funneliformis mosseae]|uniref:10956_t:CDS:1 n=1 Tax=Funneliformis mosseae TaxID=27381 RepID=A0A9N8WGT2_FUNMO|nr:10956_t:CDS:1 [Funneliformis mosseae]